MKKKYSYVGFFYKVISFTVIVLLWFDCGGVVVGCVI